MKTKPFDYDEYLAGAKVTTREGYKVLSLLKHDVEATYPLSAMIECLTEDKIQPFEFTRNGEYLAGHETQLDLVMLDEPEFNLNDCKFGDKLVTEKGYKMSKMSKYSLRDASLSKPIIEIQPDGRIFWRGREVESDEDFRKAMIELAVTIKAQVG